VRVLGRLLRPLSDALLPPACPACDGPAGPAALSWVCATCLLRIKPLPSPKCDRCWAPLGTGASRREPVNSTGGGPTPCTECERWPDGLGKVRSATALEGPARTLVHRLKYHGWEGLASVMARQMTSLARAVGADCLVPVPTTAWRRRMRGYNQAERIAEGLSRRLAIPVTEVLVRRASGRTQVSLQPQERAANVQRAFSLLPNGHSRVRGARVILVDDVLTTGATAAAATTALQQSGSCCIQVITFARALPQRRAMI